MSKSYLVVGEIVFVALLCVVAFVMFRQHPPTPTAVRADIKLSDTRAQVWLDHDNQGQFIYLVIHADGSIEHLSPQQISQNLYDFGKTTGMAAMLGLSSSTVLFWIGVGLFGQILFTGRMVVQWVASERKGTSVVPPLFWWMSLVGSLLLLAYFMWRRDPIGLLGQAFGSFIYLRNILWILEGYKPKESAAVVAEGD